MFFVHFGDTHESSATTLGCNAVRKVTLVIENCPRQGVEAVDFRRANNMPEAASNQIEVPGFVFNDEQFCREHPDKMSDDANIYTRYWAQARWNCNQKGEVYKCDLFNTQSGSAGAYLVAGWFAIHRYIREQSPASTKELLRSIWSYPDRSLERANHKAAEWLREKQRHEEEKVKARELLKDEFQTLHDEIKKLKEAERMEVVAATNSHKVATGYIMNHGRAYYRSKFIKSWEGGFSIYDVVGEKPLATTSNLPDALDWVTKNSER